MALQDIITDLIDNNKKTKGFYTVDELKEIFNNASIDVPGAKPDAITLTYSGPLDGAYSWQVAEPIGAASNGEVRTIGQTDAGKLFNRDEFREALRGAGYSTRPGRLNFGAIPDMPPLPKCCDEVLTPSRFAIFNNASIDVPGAKLDAMTLTYSGPLDGALPGKWLSR